MALVPVQNKLRKPLVLKDPLSLRIRLPNNSRVSALKDQVNLPIHRAEPGATTKAAESSPNLSENTVPTAGTSVLSEAAAPGVPLFTFSKASFSALNLFGQEYCHGRKRVSKQEVRDAYEALTDEKKAGFARLRQEKLDAKNAMKGGATSK